MKDLPYLLALGGETAPIHLYAMRGIVRYKKSL
jgi:hypothetical protein